MHDPALQTDAKARSRTTWSSGDFSAVATKILFSAELLCESADLQAGWKVLDVATGSGNAALGAARRACDVVGLDFVPALLERARERARAERLDAEFIEGDAEQLPFPDASFDAVLSIFGAMFAPDHKRTAGELARVCRPGGRIALASWTPTGFAGELFRTVAGYLPPQPGASPPPLWGQDAYLADLFGPLVRSRNSQVRTAVFRYHSPEDFLAFNRAHFGPVLKAFEKVPEARHQALTSDLTELARRFDRNRQPKGPIAVTSDYLETVMVRA